MELDAPLRIHVSAKVWGCSSLVGCLVRLQTELFTRSIVAIAAQSPLGGPEIQLAVHSD